MPCFAWGPWWLVFPLAVFAMFAIGLILFRRACRTGAHGTTPGGWCCFGSPRGSPGALETLQRRYASGDLTKGEFEGMKRDLLE